MTATHRPDPPSSSCLSPSSPSSALNASACSIGFEILAVDVLDQRFTQEVGILRNPEGRSGRSPVRPPSRRAGVALRRSARTARPRSADDERLQDPDLPDRRGEGRDGLVVEAGPWLLRVRRDRVDRHLHQSRRGLTRLGRARDQRRQPSTEPPSLRHHWPPLRNSRHRRFGASSSCNVAPMSLARSTGGPASLGHLDQGLPRGLDVASRRPRRSRRPVVPGADPVPGTCRGGRTRGSAAASESHSVHPISLGRSGCGSHLEGRCRRGRKRVGPRFAGAEAISASGAGSDSGSGSGLARSELRLRLWIRLRSRLRLRQLPPSGRTGRWGRASSRPAASPQGSRPMAFRQRSRMERTTTDGRSSKTGIGLSGRRSGCDLRGQLPVGLGTLRPRVVDGDGLAEARAPRRVGPCAG